MPQDPRSHVLWNKQNIKTWPKSHTSQYSNLNLNSGPLGRIPLRVSLAELASNCQRTIFQLLQSAFCASQMEVIQGMKEKD